MANEEKLFYTIGEVSKLVDVKPYVLRYWETEFKLLNPRKSVTGQRTYRKKDIQVALAIQKLLYEQKFTIAGAVKKLEEFDQEGFDQIDLFGEHKKMDEGGVDEAGADVFPLPDDASVGGLEPDEKLMELERLIGECVEILKKYA
ncbi:MAG: MerR family transcriptional regulator [bacterium]